MKKSNIIWNTFGGVLYSLCQWLITIIVVYVADFSAAGKLGLAMTMSSSFSAIALFSMRNYQVSDIQKEFSSTQYVSSRIWTSTVAFIMCILYAVVGNSLSQILCIAFFMFIRVAEAWVDVLHGINQKYGRYDYIGISFILRGLITVIGFTALFGLFDNLQLVLLIIGISNIIVVILFDYNKTNKLEKINISVWDSKILVLLKKCFPLVIFTFLLSLENLIPKDVLQRIYGEESLGIYSSIASPTLIVQVFSSIAFSPFLPIFSEIYYKGDLKAFKKLLHKTYVALLLMIVVVIIGAAIFGKLGLRIIFGSNILDYYYLFIPAVICSILTGMCWIISSIVILLRQVMKLLCAIIVDFIICLAITHPIINAVGSNGVNYVQIIAMSILVFMMVYICERYSSKGGLSKE